MLDFLIRVLVIATLPVEGFKVVNSSGNSLSFPGDPVFLSATSDDAWVECIWTRDSDGAYCTFTLNSTDEFNPIVTCDNGFIESDLNFFGDRFTCGITFRAKQESHSSWTGLLEICSPSKPPCDPFLPPERDSITIWVYVIHEQGKVYFDPPPENGQFYAFQEGDVERIGCVAQEFRPTPQIDWNFLPRNEDVDSFHFEDTLAEWTWNCKGCQEVNKTTEGLVTVEKFQEFIAQNWQNGSYLECKIYLRNKTSDGQDSDIVFVDRKKVLIVIEEPTISSISTPVYTSSSMITSDETSEASTSSYTSLPTTSDFSSTVPTVYTRTPESISGTSTWSSSAVSSTDQTETSIQTTSQVSTELLVSTSETSFSTTLQSTNAETVDSTNIFYSSTLETSMPSSEETEWETTAPESTSALHSSFPTSSFSISSDPAYSSSVTETTESSSEFTTTIQTTIKTSTAFGYSTERPDHTKLSFSLLIIIIISTSTALIYFGFIIVYQGKRYKLSPVLIIHSSLRRTSRRRWRRSLRS